MTSASKDLHVAQPALGLQIRQLEDEFGIALLNRHSRGVEATDAGKILYERATHMLELAAETREEIMALARGSNQTERIRLGMTPSLTTLMGSEILVTARDALPGVNLTLVEELSFSLVETLDRDEIDLALAYEVADRPSLIRHPVHEEELLFITAAHKAPPGDSITLADALKQELVLAAEKDTVYRLVAAAAERASLPFEVTYLAQSVPAMVRLSAEGLAAGIMPLGPAMAEIESGRVVAKRITNPSLARVLYMVRSVRRGRFRNEEALEAFLQHILQMLLEKLGPLARPFDFGRPMSRPDLPDDG